MLGRNKRGLPVFGWCLPQKNSSLVSECYKNQNEYHPTLDQGMQYPDSRYGPSELQLIYIYMYMDMWGLPRIRGTILGVPIMEIMTLLNLHWGPLIAGNYHISLGVIQQITVTLFTEELELVSRFLKQGFRF